MVDTCLAIGVPKHAVGPHPKVNSFEASSGSRCHLSGSNTAGFLKVVSEVAIPNTVEK